MIRMVIEGASALGFLLVCALCALLGLSGCAAVQPLLDHALQPSQHCAANGVTVTWRDGKAGYSAGCIEQAPYPGMARPGH